MSKYMITIAILLVSAIGCKTTPKSEDKGLRNLPRLKLAPRVGEHLGSLSELFSDAIIKQLGIEKSSRVREVMSRAIDDGDLGDLKKLIKEGGKWVMPQASATIAFSRKSEMNSLKR